MDGSAPQAVPVYVYPSQQGGAVLDYAPTPGYAPYATASPASFGYPSGMPLGAPLVIASGNEARLSETWALGRAMRVLSIVDGVIVLFNSLFSPFYLIALFGPICGYVGATKFNVCLSSTYFGYYILRIIFDILIISLGGYIFIISLIVDVMIARYVSMFARALRQCSPAELQQLAMAPPQQWSERRYFTYF